MERIAAYQQLLWRSAGVLQLASNLHLLIQSRSDESDSSPESLSPLHPLQLVQRLTSLDLDPFYEAVAAVWAKGTPESLVIANDLGLKCVELLDLLATTALARGRPPESRDGYKSAVEQEDDIRSRMRAFGES